MLTAIVYVIPQLKVLSTQWININYVLWPGNKTHTFKKLQTKISVPVFFKHTF